MKFEFLFLIAISIAGTTYTCAQEFDEVKKIWPHDSLMIGRKNDAYFVVNTNRNKVSAPYSKVEYQGNNFIVSSNQKLGIVNLDLEEIVPCSLNAISLLKSGDQYYFRIQNRHYGLLNVQGKTLLDTVYDYIEDRGDLISYKKQDQKYGLLNSKGKQISGMESINYWTYTNIPEWANCELENKTSVLLHVPSEKFTPLAKGSSFFTGLQINGLPDHFLVSNSKKAYSLIDNEGKTIIPFGKYTDDNSSDAPITFLRAKDHAIILSNNNGKLVQRKCKDLKLAQQGYSGEISAPYLYAYKNDSENYQLVNGDLIPVTTQQFRDLEPSEYGIIAQNTEGKFGMINEKGEEVIPFIHESVRNDVWQYTVLKKGAELYFYDVNHQRVLTDLVINDLAMDLGNYDEAYLQLKTGKLHTIVSTQDNVVLLNNVHSIHYDEETYFMQNLWVQLSERDYYHDEAKLVIVKTSTGTGLYSLMNRKFIIEPINQTVEIISYYNTESFVILVKKDGKYNLYDPAQQKFLFESFLNEISIPKNDAAIKAISDDKFYIVAGDFDHPKLQVIPLDIQYKKATFQQEYDIMVNGESAYTVTLKDKKGLLRKDGIWIHKPELERFDYLHMDRYLTVTKKGLVYIVTIDGTYITEKGFESVDFYGDGGDLAHGFVDGKEYMISENGEVMLIVTGE